MGLLDSIAAFGLAGQGYDDMDRRYRARDADISRQKVNDIAVKEALRRDELASGARSAMDAVQMRPAAKGIDITTHEGEPYDEEQRVAPGFDAPGGVDIRAKTKAAADFYANQGELDQADKTRKALSALESEGYKDVIVGVAAGRTPKEIADKFNQIGEKRIVGGTTDGKVYKFKYEDGSEGEYNREETRNLATSLGYLKKPETKIVPAGATETVDGRPVFTSAPIQRNIDPLSPAGMQAKRDFEDYKAKLEKAGGNKATELQRNVAFLVDKGIASDEGDAFSKLRTSMSRDRSASVASLMQMLKPATFMGRPEQVTALRTQAESLYESLHDGAVPKKAAVKAATQPATGVIDPPTTQEELDALPSGTRIRNPADGKIYVKP